MSGELDDLVNRLGQASGRALRHGDPCPGNGAPDKVWFLALHVPEPGQWTVIAVMIVIGFAGFLCAYLVYRSEECRLVAATGGAGGETPTESFRGVLR
ncbi:hypothetical protein OTB23_31900 [Streptomyces sp. H34-AA3]|nr:hypothetical protein [Streptomyces sp. H34-AA3]